MQSFIQCLNKSLDGRYSEREIQIFSYILLEKITGFSRTTLLINKDLMLSDEQNLLATQYVQKLQQGEPVQYVLGETEFYGLPFNVTPAVLIPRPETEELIEWIVEDVSKEQNKKLRLLDIGTGSGCIAIALKKQLTNATVSAMDVSREALQVARVNAALNGVTVDFIYDNILNPSVPAMKWDVIVSNPPYIPTSEESSMEKHVVDFEPGLALFVADNDPLVFYRKIGEYANRYLQPRGKLYVETHHAYADECKLLFEKIGFTKVEIRKDISGNERMVKAVVS